jgi:hypothetical protein
MAFEPYGTLLLMECFRLFHPPFQDSTGSKTLAQADEASGIRFLSVRDSLL